MTDLPATLARLRDLDAKATAGPFKVIREDRSDGCIIYAVIPDHEQGATIAWFPDDCNDNAKRDAECYAETRTALTAILTAAEYGRTALEVRSHLESFGERHDLSQLVNAICSCGGCGPTDPEACTACTLYHLAHRARAERDQARADLAAVTAERDQRAEELRLAQCPNDATDVGHCAKCAGLSAVRTRHLHEQEIELAEQARRIAELEAQLGGHRIVGEYSDVLPAFRTTERLLRASTEGLIYADRARQFADVYERRGPNAIIEACEYLDRGTYPSDLAAGKETGQRAALNPENKR